MIKYGYLIYWYYNFNEDIEECRVLKLTRNHITETILKRSFERIKEFKKNKTEQIDTQNINPIRCAKCAHMIICGHKTKRRNSVSLPYDKSYFELYDAKYPEILNKLKK